MATLDQLWQDQQGQDMTEYALVAGLLASLTVAIVPEMLSIVFHINDVLQAVAKACLDIAELK